MPTKLRKRQSFPPEMLLCVMQRKHAMVGFIPALDGYRGPGWGRTFHLRCVNCATERHVTIDSLGNISAQRYIHTREYRAALDHRIELEASTGDLRIEYVKRMRAEANARRSPKRRSA